MLSQSPPNSLQSVLRCNHILPQWFQKNKIKFPFNISAFVLGLLDESSTRSFVMLFWMAQWRTNWYKTHSWKWQIVAAQKLLRRRHLIHMKCVVFFTKKRNRAVGESLVNVWWVMWWEERWNRCALCGGLKFALVGVSRVRHSLYLKLWLMSIIFGKNSSRFRVNIELLLNRKPL